MNEYEEELQRRIESGDTTHNDEVSAKAYQHIFHALNKDPGYELPPNFAEKVLSKISSTESKGKTYAFFWLATGIILMALAFLAAVFSTGFRIDFGFLNTMGNYRGLVVFGLTFVALLHWLDKKLIKPDRSMTVN